MIWASGTMFGSSTPNASQDGTAGRNVNSELLYILFQHARCAGNQIFDTCILRIPRHFLLRFPCNCYLKCNIGFFLYNCKYPSLRIVFRKPSYKTCFLWPRHKDGHKSEQKKKQGSVTYSTDRENEISKIFITRNRDEQVIYHNFGFT